MTLLLLAALGLENADSWKVYKIAAEQKAFNHDVNRYMAGMHKILLDRLATNNALQAAEPADPHVLATIAAHRAIIADQFDKGLAALSYWEFPDKQALLQNLKDKLNKANIYRQRADAAIKLPRDQRDTALRETFTPAITESVIAALGVWYAVLHSAATNDPQLLRLAIIKEIGWRMREYSGYERANVATAIATGTAIAADRVIANAEWRARVNLLWQQLQNLTQGAGAHPLIDKEMRNAQIKYFKDFTALSDEMHKIGATGAKYPMSAQQWVATTDPQIDSLFQVLLAARTASDDIADAVIDRALDEVKIKFALLAIGILIAIGGIWAVSSRVARPLSRLVSIVRRLADGNTDVEIPVSRRGDELDSMAASLNAFRDGLIAAHWLRTQQEEDERRQAAERKTAMMSELADRFEATIGSIVSAVTTTSTELASAASTLSQIADDNQQLSTATADISNEASINVRSVASATGQMTSSVGEIARQAVESSKVASEAVQKAQLANTHIDLLSEMASRVGAVVKFINGISEQTNLLALNATIEAARAGAAGRGFAVVASEVKSLATQAAKATEEIAKQIDDMQTMTHNSVGTIHEVSATIGRISNISSAISAAVEEQSAVMRNISHNIREMADGTAQVAANVDDVKQGASRTSTASSQVSAAAHSLSDEGRKLRAEVDRFLATVRAA